MYGDEEVAKTPANESGAISAAFQVPPSRHGDNTITADDGENLGRATFDVESEAPEAPPAEPDSPDASGYLQRPFAAQTIA